MKRKIIKIDEPLCNGCGECITACAEGALQLIDGKAKLVKEDFCDGFGDCVGTCPTGALIIEEREVSPFDEGAVKEHLRVTQGEDAVHRMAAAQKRHQSDAHQISFQRGCPGAQMRMVKDNVSSTQSGSSGDHQAMPSALSHWPVQIHLVPPNAPFFKNKELVVMSTCGPIASADIHRRFLQGRSVVVGCPKLDNVAPYPAKLATILQEPTIPKVIVPRMEVPCCGGLTMIVQEAVRLSGRSDIVIEETIIGIDGSIKGNRTL
jgi:NAD-dependent dihydropyrimidine dehydrogenase PreA subunit